MKKKPKDILIFYLSGNLEKKSKIRNLFEKEKELRTKGEYEENIMKIEEEISNNTLCN
jgi:hypothetical protein